MHLVFDALSEAGDHRRLSLAPPRIITLGQPVAADDGAGPQVHEVLVKQLAAGVAGRPASELAELRRAAEASQLLELLQYSGPVWLVDAIVGAGAAGEVLELSPDALSALSSCSVSSHGLDAAESIQLCQTLYPETTSPEITIFAISIEAPSGYREGLSAPVAAAVERCARRILQKLQAQSGAAR